MFKEKIKNNFKIYKYYKYFNFFHLNLYLNLFIKNGYTFLFKKIFLKRLLYYIYINKICLKKSLNILMESIIKYKEYNIFFLQKKQKKYVNHKKKFFFSVRFSFLDKKKREYFYIKYFKYFFFTKNWNKKYYILINKNILDKNYNKQSIYTTYLHFFNKIVLKK